MFRQIYIWLRSSIFPDVTQTRLVVIYRRFGTTLGPILKVRAVSQKQTYTKTKDNFRCFRSEQSVYLLHCKVCLSECKNSRTSPRTLVLLDKRESC
jgi:hypothetical protein